MGRYRGAISRIPSSHPDDRPRSRLSSYQLFQNKGHVSLEGAVGATLRRFPAWHQAFPRAGERARQPPFPPSDHRHQTYQASREEHYYFPNDLQQGQLRQSFFLTTTMWDVVSSTKKGFDVAQTRKNELEPRGVLEYLMPRACRGLTFSNTPAWGIVQPLVEKSHRAL